MSTLVACDWCDGETMDSGDDWPNLCVNCTRVADARVRERAAIVAWLRGYGDGSIGGAALLFADIIERGDHLESTRTVKPRHPNCYGDGCPWCLAHDSMRPHGLKEGE